MFNPLVSVDGVSIKAPSKFVPTLSDISASDAGNAEDGTMWKCRIGQKLQFSITYENVSREDAATILTAFNPEYVTCSIINPLTGTLKEIEFYVGDRSIGTFNGVTERWESISFNIIQRSLM